VLWKPVTVVPAPAQSADEKEVIDHGTGGGGAPPTTKVAMPDMPLGSVSDWPKPFHVLPFQPSPNESVIESVHVAPGGGSGSVPANGAPPL
jgi:hypothetical protein